MKSIILFLAVGLFLVSCSKDDDTPAAKLQGSYIWVKSVGGIAAMENTPESTGIVGKMVIDNNTISFYENGEVKNTYQFSTDTVNQGENTYTLMVLDDVALYAIVENSSGILKFMDYAISDGYTHEYRKQ